MKISKIFDTISTFLFGLCILMTLTGGYTWHFGKNKVEFVSVDLWMLGAILFGLVSYRVSKQPTLLYQKAYIAMQRINDNSSKSKKWSLSFLLLMLGILYLVHWGKHWSLMTDSWDMGFIHPALFQPFLNPILKCDLCLNNTYLGEHLAFTMFVPSLVFQFFKSDILIFLSQVLFVGIGLYLLIIKGPLKDKGMLILLAMFCIFCSRSLRNSLFWDFREDHIAFLLLSSSLYFLFQGRKFLYLVMLFLSLLTKEHIGLMTIFLSIPILFESKLNLEKHERKVLAILTSIISLLYVLVAFKVLIPYFGAGSQGHNNIVYLFGEYGSTPGKIIIHVLTHPKAMLELLIRILFNVKALKYLGIILFPVVFLGYKRWWWLFPILAGLSLNLLPKGDEYKMMIFHYELAIYPYIAIWIALSLSELDFSRLNFNKLFWIVVIFFSLSGRWPLYYLRTVPFSFASTALLLNRLPSDHVVMANSKILGHLNHFKGIRPMRIPETWSSKLPEEIWPIFEQTLKGGSDEGRSRLNNQDLIVFDIRKLAEKALFDQSLIHGWKVLEETKDSLIIKAVIRDN